MIETNPNGANGSVSDPREQVMWDFYVENQLQNAYQSAIKAGYSESSALTITTRDWFIERLEKLRRKDMLSKAEKVLDKTLSYITEDDEGKVRTDLLRIQMDASKHVTSTLGKDKGYSTRVETTGKDGGPIDVASDDIKRLAEELNNLHKS